MTKANVTGNVSPEKLAEIVTRICPSWEVIHVPNGPEGWLKELTDTFSVSGHMCGDYLVEYSASNVEFDERKADCLANRISEVDEWLRREFQDAISGDEMLELGQLLAEPDLVVQRVSIEAGIKFCGTIEQGFLRIRIRGDKSRREVCIRPIDCLWRTEMDRTFGSMWESPDGDPDDWCPD